MTFTLPDLPYDYNALEPYVDAQTMHVHHTGHHAAYVKKLNEHLKQNESIADMDLACMVAKESKADIKIRQNAGGHYNHSVFWKWMAPVGTSNAGPTGELKNAIEERWGSVDEMKSKFNEAASTQFGSGYAWLGVRKSDSKLEICSTSNQDTPVMAGVTEFEMVPFLGLDVWEHAYYLKYQNKRGEYIQRWWNVVNWDYVVECYDNYASKLKPIPI